MKNITFQNIKEHVESGGNLVCTSTEGKFEVYTYNNDNIETLTKDSDDESNNIIVNGKRVNLVYMSNKSGKDQKVDKIVNNDNDKVEVNLFIEANGYQDKVESLASNVVLLTRLLCVLDNKPLMLKLCRYKPIDSMEIKDRKLNIEKYDGVCIFVGANHFGGISQYNSTQEDGNVVLSLRGNLKQLIKMLKEKLKISKRISYLRVYNIYRDYLAGNFSDKNFDIWTSVYSQYYKLSLDNNILCLPEMLATDDNTKVIVSYLLSRYRIYKFKRVTLEDRIFHPDMKVIGSSKFKADKYLSKIRVNYLKSISYISKKSLTVLLDFNGYLDKDDIAKYTRLTIPIITAKYNDNVIDILIYVSSLDLISYLSSSSILASVKSWLIADNYTIEYRIVN